jgi:uncharacterized repeat protein (TIGR01451 family)
MARSLWLMFYLSILNSFLFAQNPITFGDKNIINEARLTSTLVDGNSSLLAVDLNQDNKKDILFYRKGKIGWYQNIGGIHTFDSKQIIASELIISGWMDVGDIDNDGDLDIAVFSLNNHATGLTPHEVFWIENLGNGVFGEKQLIFTELNSYNTGKIKLADLDNNGYLDVITSHYNSNTIAWYSQVAPAEFSGKQEVASIEDVQAIEVADLDGDADLDIIGNGTNNEIFWFENLDGLGNFGEIIVLHEQNSGNSRQTIPFDIDLDGDIDLITTEDKFPFNGDRIVLYENDGQGNFAEPSIIYHNGGGIRRLLLFDCDSDGDQDLIVADYSYSAGGKMLFFENEDGFGDFSSPTVIYEQAVAYHFLQSDIDNDGKIDLIANFPSDLIWYKNLEGFANFSTPKCIDFKFTKPFKLSLEDIDNDSDLDLLIAEDNDKIAWLKNQEGLGEYHEQIIIDYHHYTLRNIALGDVDNDDDSDLFLLSYASNKLVWRENVDGIGNFDEFENTIFTMSGPGTFSSILPVDLDNDGDIDVLGTNSSNDEIIWFENLDGTGTFGEEIVLITGLDDVNFVQVADFDGDDDLDVYALGNNLPNISWFENINGNGTAWEARPINPLSGQIFDISVKDMDNDGDLDVITSDKLLPQGLKGIVWYENLDGEGNFGLPQVLFESPNFVRDIEISDFNMDGALDIAFAKDETDAFYQTQIVLLQGDIDSIHFSIAKEFPLDSTFNSKIISADLNGDGYLDIVTLSNFHDAISWYPNLENYPSISGRCFMDYNENQILDANEYGFANQRIKIEPQALNQYASPLGLFNFTVPNGAYEISPELSDEWYLTTDSAAYHLLISDSTFTDLNFGFAPFTIFTKVVANISSSATRCGFEVPFWITYENVGTTTANGLIAFEIDSLTTLISSNPQPDSINNNTYFWQFENLPPTYSESIHLVLQMPGVDELGTEVEFETTTFVQDSLGNFEECQLYKYLSTINCAYDPNDKQVTPPGVFTENLTLFDEEFEYTIRFQNTGTDTAFTVRLEDQLDTDLDWSTFHPIAASHPYSVKLTESGLVEFLFENILLPDSTTNEVASHGFTKYRIQPLSDLEENTEILNTANIFFDFNPPIQTNTTLNTMVSEITSTEETFAIVKMDVSPNPFEEEIQFQIGDLPFSNDATLTIFDVNGQRLQQFSVAANSTIIAFNRKAFPAGIYFYQLEIDGTHIKGGKLIKN